MCYPLTLILEIDKYKIFKIFGDMYGGCIQPIAFYSCLTFNISDCLSACFSQ